MVHHRQGLALGFEPGHTCRVSIPSLMILRATGRRTVAPVRPCTPGSLEESGPVRGLGDFERVAEDPFFLVGVVAHDSIPDAPSN
jgi:hypothetical protein